MSLGIVVVGGLAFSLILTLFVIPPMYLMIGKNRKALPPVVLQAPTAPEGRP
jgi:Cu/Ag efflux pump CusA